MTKVNKTVRIPSLVGYKVTLLGESPATDAYKIVVEKDNFYAGKIITLKQLLGIDPIEWDYKWLEPLVIDAMRSKSLLKKGESKKRDEK